MMTKCRQIVLVLSTALLLGAVAMPASAKPVKWNSHSYQNAAYKSGQNYQRLAQNSISPAQAKSIARRHVRGGEVVDIARKGNIYRVRVIASNGRVVDVLIDASTGRVKR